MTFSTLFKNHDAVIIFDTETSGLDPDKHQIIELAAIRVEPTENGIRIADSMDDFIKLPDGETLDTKITELTHITDEMLQSEGKSREEVAARFHQLLTGDKPGGSIVMAAHNAQFDLLFTRQLLRGHRITGSLSFLDTVTIYKDRRPYPHKLEAAIKAYKLEDKVKNSHRAIDDVCALLEVMKAMDEEREDLHTYLNIFGYNPKYGVSGEKLAGVTYRAQDFTKFKRPEYLTLPALVKGAKA